MSVSSKIERCKQMKREFNDYAAQSERELEALFKSVSSPRVHISMEDAEEFKDAWFNDRTKLPKCIEKLKFILSDMNFSFEDDALKSYDLVSDDSFEDIEGTSIDYGKLTEQFDESDL